MADKKRVWCKPELTVLVRSNPEEAVLLGCKYGTADGPNPTSHSGWKNCKHGGGSPPGPGVPCMDDMTS